MENITRVNTCWLFAAPELEHLSLKFLIELEF